MESSLKIISRKYYGNDLREEFLCSMKKKRKKWMRIELSQNLQQFKKWIQ